MHILCWFITNLFLKTNRPTSLGLDASSQSIKSATAKEHKAEVKFWRKELEQGTTKNIKLEDRLKSFENSKDTPTSPFVLPPVAKKDASNTATVIEANATPMDDTLF